MGKETPAPEPKINLLFKNGSDVTGNQVLLVYYRIDGGSQVIAGSLRLPNAATGYIESLCGGEKPAKLTLEYSDDKSFGRSKAQENN